MLYLILSILFSVALPVNFRLFPKFGINTFQAIVFNYPICFLTGYMLMEKGDSFVFDLSRDWTWYSLMLGMAFILTFILSGISTQKIGMTITSMANNISLVIPVMFSLFILGSEGIEFGFLNYLGIALALMAVGLASFKKEDGSTGKTKFFEGGGLALAVFLMYGITNTTINFIQANFIKDKFGAVPVMLVMVVGAIITGFLVLGYKLIRKSETFQAKSLIAAITLGIPNFLSFYFLILTLNHFGSSGAFVYPLYNMGVILVSALIGILIFKEKMGPLNKLGLVLAVIAIAFISWDKLFV